MPEPEQTIEEWWEEDARRYNEMEMPTHIGTPLILPPLNEDGSLPDEGMPADVEIELAFCSTGPGGGIDPTCGKDGGGTATLETPQAAPKVVVDRGIVVESGTIDENMHTGEEYEAKVSQLDAPYCEKVYNEAGMTHEAVKIYTGDDFQKINSALRHGESLGEYETTVMFLDKAIREAPPLDEDIVVSRGSHGSKRLDQVKAGDVIENKGYLSTTVSRHIARQFAGSAEAPKPSGVEERRIVVHMRVPKGTRGLYAEGPPPLTEAVGQKEFLLPRNTKMRITGVKVVDRPEKGLPGAKSKIKIINAELIK